MNEIVKLQRISKTFKKNKAVDSVDLSVRKGEMVALIGPSGSGKSTLLRLVAGLAATDCGTGTIEVFGELMQKNGKPGRRVRMLRSKTGFIFQRFNLVGRLSLFKNVMIGMVSRIPQWRSLLNLFTRNEKIAVIEALSAVGLVAYCAQRADTLSGGQQQRGAIARAIVQNAQLILADEPIASLDPESARCVMELLCDLNKNKGVTVLVSLHQIEIVTRYCTRIVALKSGRIVFDGSPDFLTYEMLEEIYGPNAESVFQNNGILSECQPIESNASQKLQFHSQEVY